MEMGFEKEIKIESQLFTPVREDMNTSIQHLITSMNEKGVDEGTVTLKINFVTEEKFVNGRIVRLLHYAYKANNSITLKEELKNERVNNLDEIDFDGENWRLTPIRGGKQRTIFDEAVKAEAESRRMTRCREDTYE